MPGLEGITETYVPNGAYQRPTFVGEINAGGLYQLLSGSCGPVINSRRSLLMTPGPDVSLLLDVKDSTPNTAVLRDRVPELERDLTKYTFHPDGGLGIRILGQGKVRSEQGDR